MPCLSFQGMRVMFRLSSGCFHHITPRYAPREANLLLYYIKARLLCKTYAPRAERRGANASGSELGGHSLDKLLGGDVVEIELLEVIKVYSRVFGLHKRIEPQRK